MTTTETTAESEIIYEPSVGTHIDNACKEATAKAINSGKRVRFKFNDIELVATPSVSWKELAGTFSRECDRRREEYERSPEGQKAASEREKQVSEHQQTVNDLIERLPEVLSRNSLDEVMRWLDRFYSPADDIAVKFPSDHVIQLLEQAGFSENAHVGHDPEWFITRRRMGEYVIGQAINCMRRGMAPHGITGTFVKKYFALHQE